MRDGARPQASTYVQSPMPRSLPLLADADLRLAKLAQSDAASAFSRQPFGSPLSYSTMT